MTKIQEMQYKNLREGFNLLVKTILGEKYYNMSIDVYGCDLQCCSDIVGAYNNKTFGKVKNPFTNEQCSEIIDKSINSIKHSM